MHFVKDQVRVRQKTWFSDENAYLISSSQMEGLKIEYLFVKMSGVNLSWIRASPPHMHHQSGIDEN